MLGEVTEIIPSHRCDLTAIGGSPMASDLSDAASDAAEDQHWVTLHVEMKRDLN